VNSNTKIAVAVSAALGACGYGNVAVAQTAPAAAATETGLEEIIVTAQRRTESIQDVPMTIQALSGLQLEQLNVTTIEEAVKLLPNVSVASNGPGMGEIQMRGLSTGFRGGQSASTIAPFSAVALYLDEESMQFPARNADVYFIDMERIEALEGPQGTLYGGSAEGGAVRYITNKPNLDKTEGSVNASYGFTAGGDQNSSASAVLNVPVIPGTLALRAVVYNDRHGGYITNVGSEFVRSAVNDVHAPPADSAQADNYLLAGGATNPVTYSGARLSLLAKFNDDWNLLIAESFQNLEADGSFTQFPIGSDFQTLGAWQDTTFSPEWSKDRYENTAWTLTGKLAGLKVLYTGSYLTRHIDQSMDYTNYTRSANGYYYSCSGGPNSVTANLGGVHNWTPTCYSPVSNWRDQAQNEHTTQELRISTPDDWRIRGLAGIYWEDFIIRDEMDFYYDDIPTCTPTNLANDNNVPCVGTLEMNPAAVYVNNPSVRGENDAFGEDDKRGYKQTAAFASVDFDIIPKVLTVTGGTRYYNYGEFLEGQQFSDTTCTNVPNGTCINGPLFNDHRTDHGFKSRGNITWHITPEAMVYYTFSQGFRPGTFDRSTKAELPLVPGLKCSNGGECQYSKPLEAFPDTLVNNEIGWKSEWLDHRLIVNGSVYHMIWSNVQLGIYDPYDGFGHTTFPVNGPNYAYNGAELQLQGKVTDSLTLTGTGTWNHAWQTNQPCLVSNIPSSPTYNMCITESAKSNGTVGPLFNLLGSKGSVAAFSPDLQFNVRARYDFTLNEYKAFFMADVNYISGMWNQPASYSSGAGVLVPYATTLRYYQPGYSTYDASFGVTRDNWTAELYGTNLSNSDASTFTSSAQYIKSEVPLRPRVLAMKIGYKF
jgi:iron complex outermembrane recepter protein